MLSQGRSRYKSTRHIHCPTYSERHSAQTPHIGFASSGNARSGPQQHRYRRRSSPESLSSAKQALKPLQRKPSHYADRSSDAALALGVDLAETGRYCSCSPSRSDVSVCLMIPRETVSVVLPFS